MFLVCDPISYGEEHVPFNAGLLKIIRLAFLDQAVSFYAEKTHIDYVRNQIGKELSKGITWQSCIIPQRHTSFYNRFSADFKIVKYLLNVLNKQTGNNILVVSGNSSILWALKLLSWKVRRGNNIQVIFHGILASLIKINSSFKLKIESINPFFQIRHIRTALKIPGNRNIQYIVLENSIRKAVLKNMPSLKKSIEVLDHPIPLDKLTAETNDCNFPIQFGFLGRASEYKGFPRFLDVASEISRKFPGMADFHVIGRIGNRYREKYSQNMNYLYTKPGKERLSRDEYVRRVMKLHYICLFIDDRHYELSASGVLLDSIAYEKPVIATQLPIVKNIEQKYGDIGYLCNSTEFSDTISTILRKFDYDRYRRQVLNMRQVKRSRAPESLALKYREIVKRCN